MTLKLLCLCLLIASAFASAAQQARYPAASVPPPVVYADSIARTMRYRQNFFNMIRRNFALLDELEQAQIENLGWKPPSLLLTTTVEWSQYPINGKAGQDFLHNIIKMIERVNKISSDNGQSWFVDGWTQCPAPTDLNWPVPPVPADLNLPEYDYASYIDSYKTDQFYNDFIVPAESDLTANLATLTLEELGVKIEYELFTWFLYRFCGSNPIGYRIQGIHPTAFVAEKWDDEDYDLLFDFYSAHVNPTFWKIAGWVQKQVEDWATANGMTGSSEITWISTWEGGPSEVISQLWKVAADAKARQEDEGEEDEEIGNDSDNSRGIAIAALVIALLGLILGVGSCGYVVILKQTMKNRAVTPMKIPEDSPLKAGERFDTDR